VNIMSINLKSLLNFFSGLYHKLLGDLESDFNDLPKDEQDALIKGGQFGEIVKQNFRNGYHAVLADASHVLGLSEAQADELLVALGKKLGINSQYGFATIDYLQSEFNKGLEDSSWDALWTTVSGQLQIILGGGKVNWVTVAIGLTEFVYQKFVKGKVGK